MKFQNRLKLWVEDFFAYELLKTASGRLEDIFYAEQLRWFLFLPVAFGLGIYFYFSLSYEPSIVFASLVVVAAILIGALIVVGRGSDSLFILCAVACFAFSLGFAVSYHRAHSFDFPRIEAASESIMSARIKEIDATRAKKTQVWLVEPISIGGDSAEALPKRMRLRVKPFTAREKFRAGDEISVRAFLLPPPAKVLPDGFDHRRNFWFKQLGGTALALDPPQRVKKNEPTFYEWLDSVRNELARRIDKILTHPSEAGIAAALIVGKRSFISEALADKLRGTGLAHILAISGLHMVAFAGTIYFILRFLLALVPALALRYEIKKWAMVPALFASVVYLFLSGASVSTQRAFIMFAIAGFAVLRGANVLTLRNLAFAALIILVLFPESLLQAGFQLSFAATLAIIATYEQVQFNWFTRSARDDSLSLLRRRVMLGALTLLLTSLVAWSATAPFSLFHFNRVGFVPALSANFVVLPLFTLGVMPAVVAAVPALLLGGGEWTLHILGQGLEIVLTIITFIATHVGVARITAAPIGFLLPLFVFGGLWLCLWRQAWRWLGAVVLVVFFALSLLLERERADMIVGARLFAVRGADGKLYPSAPDNWLVSQWLLADGDGRSPWSAFRSNKIISCDKNKCKARIRTTRGSKIRIIFEKTKTTITTTIPCEPVDIFIGETCVGSRLTLRPAALKAKGTHVIYFNKGGELTVRHSAPEHRLWSK